MRISYKIEEELKKRGVPYDYTTHTPNRVSLGLIAMADDRDGFVVRPVVSHFLKNRVDTNHEPILCSEQAFQHLPEEERSDNVLYQYLPTEIEIFALDPVTYQRVPKEDWYEKTDKVIEEILKELPHLKTAI